MEQIIKYTITDVLEVCKYIPFGAFIGVIFFGFFVPIVFSKCRTGIGVIFLGMLFSLCCEGIQLVTQRGYFQLDDIIMNVLGSGLGYVCYWLFLLE